MKYINLIKKISVLVLFVSLALLAVIAADITITVISKKIQVPVKKEKKVSHVTASEEKKKELIYYKEIFDNNIFDVAILDTEFFEKKTMEPSQGAPSGQYEAVVYEKAEEVNELDEIEDIDINNYELYGTVVANPGSMSLATIYNKKERTSNIYGLKEYNRYIDDKYEIIEIRRNAVEVKTRDGSVALESNEEAGKTPGAAVPPVQRYSSRHEREISTPIESDGKGITQVGENSYVIDQRFYESLTKDVSSLMTLQRQINFIPKLDAENKPMGFEVRRITPGSLFQQIGIKRGDIVKSINNRVLNAMSVTEALQLLNDMKSETNIELGVTRGGESTTIGYEVR